MAVVVVVVIECRDSLSQCSFLSHPSPNFFFFLPTMLLAAMHPWPSANRLVFCSTTGQKETVFKTRKRRNKPKRKKERRGKKKKNQSESTTTEGRKKSQSESTTPDDRKKSQSEPSTTDGRKKSQSESSTPDDRKKSQSESSTTEGRKKSQSESSTTEGRKKNGGGKQGKKPRNKRIRRKLSEEGDSHTKEDAEKKLTNQRKELTSKANLQGAPTNLERRQEQDEWVEGKFRHMEGIRNAILNLRIKFLDWQKPV